jgi:tetratricopeptide (TPR) repeat protein
MVKSLKISLFTFLAVVVFITIFQQTNYCQNTNRISGFVFGPARQPVAEIYIELINEVNSVIGRVKTNGSGQYFFTGLTTGRFTIKILPFGTNLDEQTKEVEIVNNVARGSFTSASIQEDFYLKIKKGGSQDSASAGAVFFQEVPKEAEKLYEQAVTNLSENKTDLGIADLQNALKIFPTYYLALEKLGTEYIKLQNYEKSKEIFLKAVSINQRSGSGWYGLSFSYYALKESKLSIETAQKAASFTPNSVDIMLLLGIALRQDSQYQEAEKVLLKAKKLADGKKPDINWNLALLYAHNLKRYRDAANELELYLKAKPDHPNAAGIQKLILQFRSNQPSNNFT